MALYYKVARPGLLSGDGFILGQISTSEVYQHTNISLPVGLSLARPGLHHGPEGPNSPPHWIMDRRTKHSRWRLDVVRHSTRYGVWVGKCRDVISTINSFTDVDMQKIHTRSFSTRRFMRIPDFCGGQTRLTPGHSPLTVPSLRGADLLDYLARLEFAFSTPYVYQGTCLGVQNLHLGPGAISLKRG